MLFRLLFVGFLFFLNGCSSIQSSSFVVPQSTFAKQVEHMHAILGSLSNVADQNAFVLRGHEIVSGGGMLIGWREFGSANRFLVDQGSFQKLSIWLDAPSLAVGELALGNSSIGFWSSGAAEFPGASGCMGYLTNGKIVVKAISGDQISIEIDLHFDQNQPIGIQSSCRKVHLKRAFTAVKKTVINLTDWEGKVGGDLFSEAHPP